MPRPAIYWLLAVLAWLFGLTGLWLGWTAFWARPIDAALAAVALAEITAAALIGGVAAIIRLLDERLPRPAPPAIGSGDPPPRHVEISRAMAAEQERHGRY